MKKEKTSIAGHRDRVSKEKSLLKNGVLPDGEKISAIVDYRTPQDKTDVQRLLGMIKMLHSSQRTTQACFTLITKYVKIKKDGV